MLVGLKDSLNQFLARIGAELDIPDDVYEDAVVEYERVAEWLHSEDSPLRQYEPEIFAQGSFRLGTSVRPITSDGEYDIDLVCRLNISRVATTQKQLKHKIGDRLKAHEEFKAMLKESRRCWTLDYPHQFHMDILPSIPNDERPPSSQAILLTDKELHYWQKSNPKAYAEWFYQRMRVMITRQKARLLEANAVYKSIEEVPEWKVRTPLQRAVQLLKRHRDIYFADNLENCPVSIILTTLAALAYKEQDNIYDAIVGLVSDMAEHIKERNGKWWVANPVEPEENFADKWNEKPAKYFAFRAWLTVVKRDFEQALNSTSLKEATAGLDRALGASDIGIASLATSLGFTTTTKSPSARRTSAQVPALGNARHARPLLWPEQRIYDATISSRVYFRKYGKTLWPVDNSTTIRKGLWVCFSVKTNTPQPYDVKWQVVNTGSEAENARQPRGEFYNSDRSARERWESTAYRGTHWVEALIIKNNTCVARSGPLLVKVR